MDKEPDPFQHFEAWYQEATEHRSIGEANAMNLATSDADGNPSSRIVLMKDYGTRGFVFYTNLGSRKARQLAENPNASLCFFWEPLLKQVRVEGQVTPVSEEEANNYFNSRPLDSRIGAWASRQSQPLKNRATLAKEVAKYSKKFLTGNVPRPSFWSGFCLVPKYFEFWQMGKYRLHDRVCYQLDGEGNWRSSLLFP